LIEGVHIVAICSHLQAVTQGRIANLIINVPRTRQIVADGRVLASLGVD
jgi:hypothetical protein